MQSSSAFTSIAGLVALFWIVFALIGMHGEKASHYHTTASYTLIACKSDLQEARVCGKFMWVLARTKATDIDRCQSSCTHLAPPSPFCASCGSLTLSLFLHLSPLLPLCAAFGGLTLDLSYLDFNGYPNFDTFLSSMTISYEVRAA